MQRTNVTGYLAWQGNVDTTMLFIIENQKKPF